MKIRKLLSVMLCLCMALSYASSLKLPVNAATQTVRIEAEDAYWHGYGATPKEATGASGKVLGDASGAYALWEEFNKGKLNKNIHIYVVYTVDVPVEGTYQISVGNRISMKSTVIPYAAIAVNPLSGASTVAYKLTYNGTAGTTGINMKSKSVDVQLQKGRNVIYMAPFTSDQNINWADADYIEISGAQAVTPIVPDKQNVAANAGYYYNFSNAGSDGLRGGSYDKSNPGKLTASTIKNSTVSALAYASYTVDAPEDGYYDIDLKYSTSSANTTSNYAFALLKDSQAAEVKRIYASSGTADISTYLTKGSHVLTVPVVLPLSTSGTLEWTDLLGITLYGGLKLNKYQKSILHAGNVLEAERDALTWRYPDIEANEGNQLVGGSQPGATKQTYAELAGGAKLNKNQPMLTYYVDVETSGTYTMNTSFRGYTGSDYYMIVSVDDVTYYKAGINGADPTRANRWLATTAVELTAGRHYVRVITLPGDTKATWLNVDYSVFSGPGSVAAIRDWKYLQSGNADYVHGFTTTDLTSLASLGKQWQKALGGYLGNGLAAEAGVTTENFKPSDLENMGWFSYTLDVPYDGYYDMQTYVHPNPSTSGTGKILMGIENVNVNLINQAQNVLAMNYTGNNSGWMDIYGEYKAIAVTAKNYLPMEQSADTDTNVGYSVVLRIAMDNGQFYAFRIVNDKTSRYGYCRFGADGAATGWDGWAWVDQAATELINGAGAQFKVERTGANILTVTLNGKIVDTYTMDGITADNKVVSVGLKHYGNPASDQYVVEVPFEATPLAEPISVQIADMENGVVSADKSAYVMGDTVTLTITSNPGYSQKLYVNGKPLLLNWKTNKYSFVATEEVYNITGSFEPSLSETPSDAARWDTSNQAHGYVSTYYPKNTDSWWLTINGEYKAVSVIAKNGLPVEESMDNNGNPAGYHQILRMTLSNGKSYAFRLYNDKGTYATSRTEVSGSVTGWGGWKKLDDAAAAAVNGDGVEYKIQRTAADTITVTVNGVVVDTYKMEGVTEADKVVSVGIQQNRNNGLYVDIPFTLTKVGDAEAVAINTDSEDDGIALTAENAADDRVNIIIGAMANGTVTAEMPVYKIGDIVELTVIPDDGYSQKLTINGEPVLLDWKTGKYSFVATENSYRIAGNFDKSIWSNTSYKWVDVCIDGGAEKWGIADLSSYLSKGKYVILVSGLMDYTDGSYNWSDMGALTVTGGITASNAPVEPSTQQTPAVTQWNLVLGDRIGIQFAIQNLNADDSVDFYIGDELLPSEAKAEGMYITYIAPAQMTDEVTIRVNGIALARTYSVRTYANAILAGDYADTQKNLVRAMLQYGGVSQVYFQYHTERLANAGVDVEDRDFSKEFPLITTEQSCVGNITGVYFYGVSLLFQERNGLCFYFSGNTDGCTFAVNGQTVTPVEKNNKQCVTVNNILPQDFNQSIQVTVTRGQESITVSYSPMHYVERMYQKNTSSDSLKNTLEALYYYHKAAAEYGNLVWNVVTQVEQDSSLFYRNINVTDIPDPFVLDNTAIDGYYYIYGTVGAISCFRSKNMMDWEYRGDMLKAWQESNKVWDSAKNKYSYQTLGSELWAPELVYDPDTKLYYMFFSATPDLEGQAVAASAQQMLMVATCDRPDGDFSVINFKDAASCGAGNVHTYSTSTYKDYFAKYLFLDPAQSKKFSLSINNNEDRPSKNGGYLRSIDPHPYVTPDGTKYLFWVDCYGPDRICGVEMENWLKPKWETAKALIYFSYFTVADWKNNSTNKVPYETSTTTNEGPFIMERNGKYYMTYSAGNYKNNTYFVAQAVADNILGPYTKLKESDGGVLLSSYKQDNQGRENTGTGHHSFITVGDQLYIIYHRHNDVTTMGGARNHAIDEVKWMNINGQEVMYVNGPTANLQPRIEAYSTYRNIAQEATVTSSVSSANTKFLNDGLLSHYKNANSTFVSYIKETTITGETTFKFDFKEARTVKSIMVYNSKTESQIFREIQQIKLVCVENGKQVTKYIYNVPFNAEHFTTNSSGNVTYVQPCSSAYAVFDELQVISVEITIQPPAGQSTVGISEIRILGK